jgi:hypothetical protein
MSGEVDPDAEVDWGNVEEVGSDNVEDDDNDHDNDDIDDSGEDNDEEESDNDDDDDDDYEEKMKNMETFIRTFHNGDFDTEFDNVFSFHRRENVALVHRATQASPYSKPDNWIERNRIGLERSRRSFRLVLTRCRMTHKFQSGVGTR